MLRFLLPSLALLTTQPPRPAGSLFNQIYQKTEDQYHKAQGTQKDTSNDSDNQKDVKQQKEEIVAPKVSELSRSRQSLLAKHKEYSDDWWKTLFSNCQGCKDSEEDIDCPRLLDDNPQWHEVADMPTAAQKLIMKRALSQYYNNRSEFYDDKIEQNVARQQRACVLACAICAGGNPDERIEGDEPHTALHVVSMRPHYSLFRLLLKKGADVNLKCQPALPRDFAFSAKWRDDLRKLGKNKLEENDNSHDD